MTWRLGAERYIEPYGLRAKPVQAGGGLPEGQCVLAVLGALMAWHLYGTRGPEIPLWRGTLAAPAHTFRARLEPPRPTSVDPVNS
jgi:hypothetical protein